MDVSDDCRKKNINLNDWTNSPFERVNHSTNFEDYACSSEDTHYLYTSSEDKSDSKITTPKAIQSTDRDSLPNGSNKISFKVSKFEPTVTPIVSKHLSEQRNNSFVESCLSAGNSSADVTPSGTPQSSPYTVRKAMETNKMSNNNNNTKNILSTNPKRWFYTGFFNSDIKTSIPDKPHIPLPKNPSFKNLCVSNFDINAVGPTSW